MVTRAQIREEGNRGLVPDDMRAVRLTRLEQAAEDAFGAATLLEAQEAIGAAVPGIVTSITLSASFDSPAGAAPQTTATRTLTVPAGNPGRIVLAAGTLTVTLQHQINAGAYAGIDVGDTIEVNDADTLNFRVNVGVGSAAGLQLTDATTGALIGAAFTITTT